MADIEHNTHSRPIDQAIARLETYAADLGSAAIVAEMAASDSFSRVATGTFDVLQREFQRMSSQLGSLAHELGQIDGMTPRPAIAGECLGSLEVLLDSTAYLAKELNWVCTNLGVNEVPTSNEIDAMIFKSSIVRGRLEDAVRLVRSEPRLEAFGLDVVKNG